MLQSCACWLSICCKRERRSSSRLTSIPGAGRRLSSAVGQIRQVALEDGSSVTLDTNTLLTARYSKSRRLFRLLRGRARFAVHPDPARPFIVAAGGAEVVARSAQFDVDLAAPHGLGVTPVSGAIDVQVRPLFQPWRASPLTTHLGPGQQADFDRFASRPCVQKAPAGDVLWPTGFLSFERTPLADVVAQANRYSVRKIRLSDPALGALQVSGVFKMGAPRELAASLAALFSLRLVNKDGGDIELAPASAP